MSDEVMACIAWWGAMHGKDGYGQVARRGRVVLAHRHVYEECFGPIAEGHMVHHMCENRACVNPAHLASVTRAEHIKIHGFTDRGLRAAPAARRRRTHCKHGHEYNLYNTYFLRGARYCRACNKRATAKYNAKKRAERIAARA